MIERIKLFIGFDDFYNKKELLKKQFSLMSLEEKEMFKIYIYSTLADNKYEADRLIKDETHNYNFYMRKKYDNQNYNLPYIPEEFTYVEGEFRYIYNVSITVYDDNNNSRKRSYQLRWNYSI